MFGIGSAIEAAVRRLLISALPGLFWIASAAAAPQQVRFEQVQLPETLGKLCTSLAIGPDGRLYGAVRNGRILRWPILSDGTVGPAEKLDSLQLAENGPRLLIGFAFDPSAKADDLVVWVSHSSFGFQGMPDWGGKITRLSGPELQNVQDFVVGLPRSSRDHVTNGIDFGPDGALYFTQGSNSAMGAPDADWADRPERLLSAAVLRLDVDAVTSPPLQARTDRGQYDPYASGAPLTIYASGVRNAYDLVWHSNGELYVPTNGSRAGGNTPAGAPRDRCANGGVYFLPPVPGLNGVSTQPDYLYRAVEGGYYGHPNPLRCEFVMNGGNPSASIDPGEVSDYPVGTLAEPNYRGFSFNFGDHQSPNGIIEYSSKQFRAALRGSLLVVRFSAGNDIMVLTPGGPNQDIVDSQLDIEGFTGFSNPLDLVEDPETGNIYVAEYGLSQITLLRPL